MFKNEVIDRDMHCIMHNFKKNGQICLFSLADLNIAHYVELTFFEMRDLRLYNGSIDEKSQFVYTSVFWV